MPEQLIKNRPQFDDEILHFPRTTLELPTRRPPKFIGGLPATSRIRGLSPALRLSAEFTNERNLPRFRQFAEKFTGSKPGRPNPRFLVAPSIHRPLRTSLPLPYGFLSSPGSPNQIYPSRNAAKLRAEEKPLQNLLRRSQHRTDGHRSRRIPPSLTESRRPTIENCEMTSDYPISPSRTVHRDCNR